MNWHCVGLKAAMGYSPDAVLKKFAASRIKKQLLVHRKSSQNVKPRRSLFQKKRKTCFMALMP